MKPTFRIGRIACLLALLCCALTSSATQIAAGNRPHPLYRFVSLDQALPPGFMFFAAPMKVTNARRVYMTAWANADPSAPSIVAVQNGVAKILYPNAIFYDATEGGLIGGSVLPDPSKAAEHAALFKDGIVKLLRPMDGEASSQVLRVTDSGWVLVSWVDTADRQHYYVEKGGKVTPLDTEGASISMLDMNRRGIVSGTISRPGVAERAFRLDPFSRKLTLLDPLPTEPRSWGMGINHRGDVLGYSFVNGGRERIGVWRGTRFTTYFVEGTPEFPTISNSLLWNERGEIVITETSRDATFHDPNSYLVPRPGVRLSLADITDRMPFCWTWMHDINERGDILGEGGPDFFNIEGTFLLERIGGERRMPDEANGAGREQRDRMADRQDCPAAK